MSRARARELQAAFAAQGDPTGWFEAFYAEAGGDAAHISWADLQPNPQLEAWLTREQADGAGKLALVTGCGLGDDAEALQARRYHVTAFDISPTAVRWCLERFPKTKVEYLAGDLLNPPKAWAGAFDLVVEIYTLQCLWGELREQAIERLASFVRSDGLLLIIARGRNEDDDPGEMPWPLTIEELSTFEEYGLKLMQFEDFFDGEAPPVRRFRALFQRVA